MALEELSPLAFGLCGHKYGSHAGVDQVHVSQEFETALTLAHLAMSQEHVCHLVTLLPHIHVVAELLHCCLQHLSQPSAVLREVVGDVGNCAIVVVHRRKVYVGVPCHYPLRIVVVDEYLVNIAPEENFASFPGLLHYCHLVLVVCDGFFSAF